VELRVWYRRPDGIFVDLLVEWQKEKEEVRVRKSDDPRGIYYPRLCKLWYHSPRQSFILDAHHVDRELYFYTVAQLSVLPTWPPRQYQDEGDQLLLLGGAHEVARRHDEEARRCSAARRIQSVWREASACPERAVCRRRLLREFDDMT
jgi:hypothetical protein